MSLNELDELERTLFEELETAEKPKKRNNKSHRKVTGWGDSSLKSRGRRGKDIRKIKNNNALPVEETVVDLSAIPTIEEIHDANEIPFEDQIGESEVSMTRMRSLKELEMGKAQRVLPIERKLGIDLKLLKDDCWFTNLSTIYQKEAGEWKMDDILSELAALKKSQ